MSRDLRVAFIESARELADLMRRARCDANWLVAAERLKSLSATFGIIPLIQLAEEAMSGVPGDPVVLREINALVESID
ncbi:MULTISPECIES: Hpt domain-containing protein [Sphingopyxis]|nr:MULTISPECIES: Hpt domain-containing protein [Sphingopyxis]